MCAQVNSLEGQAERRPGEWRRRNGVREIVLEWRYPCKKTDSDLF